MVKGRLIVGGFPMGHSTHLPQDMHWYDVSTMWHAYAVSPAAVVFVAAVAGMAAGIAMLRAIDWLPVWVGREWRAQCSELYGFAPPMPAPVPRHRRPWRAAGVSAISAAACAACAWRYGATPAAAVLMAFACALVLLAWVDAESGLLPDIVTLPLLWAGLLVNLHGALVPLPHAVLGAALGYAVLWSVFHIYRLLTGRIGMGHGDFKLVAAIGAWLGVGALPVTLLAASFLGVAVGLARRVAGRAGAGQTLPFGPCLAAGAAVAALAGNPL